MKKHTIFSKVIAVIVSLVLTVCLCASMVLTVSLYSLRQSFTERNVENWIENIDFKNLELPDGNGGSTTYNDLMTGLLEKYGIPLETSAMDTIIDDFSFYDILTDVVNKIRASIFDDGLRPVFEPYGYAETAVENMDEGMLWLVEVLFGDATQTVAEVLGVFTDTLNSLEELDFAAELNKIFGFEALVFISSVVLMLCVLLIAVNWSRKRGGVLCILLASLASGGLILFGTVFILTSQSLVADYVGIPASTLYLILNPVMKRLGGYGKIMLIAGGALTVLFIVILIINSVSAKINRKKVSSLAYVMYDETPDSSEDYEDYEDEEELGAETDDGEENMNFDYQNVNSDFSAEVAENNGEIPTDENMVEEDNNGESEEKSENPGNACK